MAGSTLCIFHSRLVIWSVTDSLNQINLDPFHIEMAVANSSNFVKSHLYLKLNGQATLLCYISLFSGYLGDTEVKQLNSTFSLLDPSLTI